MTYSWKAAAFGLLCLLLPATFTHAQRIAAGSVTPSRIVEPIEDGKVARLAGNTHPMAQLRYDLGRVDRSLAMERMVLVLKRSPQQEAALEKFMAQQYDPKAPNFHHWLKPVEFGRLYGPSDSDIAMITNWLQNSGFRVENVSSGRVTIEFSGTAAQVEQAFHTEMHRYLMNGVEHIANNQDPAIPQALVPVVTGIASLHNFFPKPQHILGRRVRRDRTTGQIRPADTDSSVSQLTWTDGSGNIHEDITPSDFATIYNLTPLWNAGITGAGATIAISAGSDVNASDVATFRSTFGLPASPITTIHNGTDPGMVDGYLQENTLDVEWSGATAPSATIELVVSADTQTTPGFQLSDQYIVDNALAPIMSASYGQCELDLGTAGNATYNSIWQQGAAEGISIFESSGDQGSTGCENSDQAGPNAATTGLQVNGMASSPYVTAVGGTDFTWQASPTSTYWNSTNNVDGATAKGYIPEMPWNSTCASVFVTAVSVDPTPEAFCNDVYFGINYIGLDGLVVITGGSGGESHCTTPSGSTPSTCSGGYPKPSWQAGTGVPNDGKRDLPDVSLFASGGYPDGLNGSAYLVCISSDSPVKSCAYDANDVIYQEIGGTSASSPAMAGIMALVLQKVGAPQGLPNPVLYSLAATENLANCNSSTVTNGNTCIFYDTTYGTNSQVCVTGSTNCVTKTSGDALGIVSGYTTQTGYDLATGLGSLNAANLVNAWPAAIGKVSLTRTSLTFSSTPVGTSSSPQVITLKNTGTGILSINAIEISGTGYQSYSGTTTCPFAPSTLNPGGSCTVSILFTPTTTGTITAQLKFYDNATGASQTASLTGTGTTSSYVLTVTEAGTGSGSVSSNSPGISCPSICSAGFASGTTVTLTAAALSGSTFAGWSGACSGTGTCSVTVSAAKAVTATFNSSSTPAVTLTPTSLTFGTVAIGVTSTAKSISLKNSGTAPLTITSITVTGTSNTDFPETNTCPSTLAAGASCTIKVQFKPTASGVRSANVSISDNAAGSPQQVTLSGTGTAAKLAPNPLSFGDQATGTTGAVKKVTLTNVGTTAISITSIAVTGSEAADFPEPATTCTSSLAPAASCTISLTFRPSTIGVRSATLTVTDNASGSPQTVSLGGAGTTAELTPTSLSFGTVTVGTTSAAETVTLKNVGSTSITSIGITIAGTDPSDFAFATNGCGTSLAANASCTFSVTFKPTATGARSASVTVTDSAAGSPQKVSLAGSGR